MIGTIGNLSDKVLTDRDASAGKVPCGCAQLLEQACNRCDEGSQLKPETPIGFRQIELNVQFKFDLQIEFLQTDFHRVSPPQAEVPTSSVACRNALYHGCFMSVYKFFSAVGDFFFAMNAD